MHKIVTICLSVVILLCGCGSKGIQNTPVQTEVPVPTAASESELQKNPQNMQEIVQQLNQVSETGAMVAIVQGENSLFCVQKEKEKNIVCYWDLITGSSIKKDLPCSLMRKGDVQQTEGRVVFYGDNKKVIVVDQEFNVVDELTIKDKLVDGIDRNYCVLPNEKKIVYTKEMLKNGEWYQEVNECDYNGKNKRQICRIEDAAKSVGEVNQITGLVVSKNEKILFFCGLYHKTTDVDETSFPCFGEINRDTGEVVSIQEEKSPGQLLGNKMMFVDGLREKGVSSSGYIICLDENGRQEKYLFDKKEESQEVIVSDGGNYYLSYERMEEGMTRISCYSFKKSTYQWTREISKYVSEIWYFEQAKVLLYAFYDDEGNLCLEKEDIKG